MLDYHLHLWPHGERDVNPTIDYLASYCESAREKGVFELAITEHFFRFKQADWLLGKWWEKTDDSDILKKSMAKYWYEHIGADLDRYIDCALEAKRQGLPIVIGLELDYYPGIMDKIKDLLDQYPFDVILGSIHWIGTWRFDDLGDAISMSEWKSRKVESAWLDYGRHFSELAESKVADVVAHPDLIKIANKLPDIKFRESVEDTIIDSILKNRLTVEISTAGLRKPVNELYPSTRLLQKLSNANVAFTTASDAHSLNYVSYKINELKPYLQSLGIETLNSFKNRIGHKVKISS